MGGSTKFRHLPSQTACQSPRQHDFILFWPFWLTGWFRVLLPPARGWD